MSADLWCWRPQTTSISSGRAEQGWDWWGRGWGRPPDLQERPPGEPLLWSSCGNTESECTGKIPAHLGLDKNSCSAWTVSPDTGSSCSMVCQEVHTWSNELLAANTGSIGNSSNITNILYWCPFYSNFRFARVFHHSETLQLQAGALVLGGTQPGS